MTATVSGKKTKKNLQPAAGERSLWCRDFKRGGRYTQHMPDWKKKKVIPLYSFLIYLPLSLWGGCGVIKRYLTWQHLRTLKSVVSLYKVPQRMDGGRLRGKLRDFLKVVGGTQAKQAAKENQGLSSSSTRTVLNIYNVWGCKWRRTCDLPFVYLYFLGEIIQFFFLESIWDTMRSSLCFIFNLCAKLMFNLKRGISGKRSKISCCEEIVCTVPS